MCVHAFGFASRVCVLRAMDRGSVKHSRCGLALIVLVRRPRRSVGDSSLDHLVLCACSFVFCVRVWNVRTDPVV